VVLLSSRLGLVCVPRTSSPRQAGHQHEAPFYQRYGSKLPSSLTRDHSSTLACSASLPVSVCGTGRLHLPSPAFLDCIGAPPLRWVSPPPLALASRSTALGLTSASLPAWTAHVSPRQLPISIRHRSNDLVIVRDCLPVVHRWSSVKTPLRPD
jgi:hypothetical protein